MERVTKQFDLSRQEMKAQIDLLRGEFRSDFDLARAKAVGRPAGPAGPAPVHGQVAGKLQMRDGVPVGVYGQIAADAAKEWPGNYQMQAFVIKRQSEAYRKLNP
jgi:hypothetical protein